MCAVPSVCLQSSRQKLTTSAQGLPLLQHFCHRLSKVEQQQNSVLQYLSLYLVIHLTFYRTLTPAWLACFVNFCAEDNSVYALGKVLPDRFAAKQLCERGVSELTVYCTTTECKDGVIGHTDPCSKFCKHLFPTRAEAQIQLVLDRMFDLPAAAAVS